MNAKVCPKVDSVGGTTELIWLGNCLVERAEVDVFFFIFSLIPTDDHKYNSEYNDLLVKLTFSYI